MRTSPKPEPLQTLTLQIEGMTCASCVRRVERALAAVPGVLDASVNLATNQAVVHQSGVTAGQPDVTQAALKAIESAGYQASAIAPEAESPDQPVDHARTLGRHAAWAALLSAPLVAPMLVAPMGVHWMLPSWLQALLASLVLFGLGSRFFVSAYKALRHGGANMDVLVVLGTLAAWLLSVWLWRQDPDGSAHALYFESAAVVVALVLLGKWLEARAKRGTLAALQSLKALRPDTAMRRRDGVIVRVALADVRVGDELIVAPGERLATDGVLLEGRSHLDESMLSGESVPRVKEPGDALHAGTLNAEGQMVMRTSAIGAQTSLGRIVKLVEAAQAKKPPIQLLVDQVAEWFVPVVIVIAALTGLGWWMAGAATATAVINAVSVLVIACPCALGLATPAALMVGTGLAAERGILVRDAPALEAMQSVKLVAFDKTGTLTQGRPQVVRVEPTHPSLDAGRLLRTAAALQVAIQHPLAQAVVRAAEASAPGPAETQAPAEPPMQASDIKVVSGRGVQGVVQGAAMRLGSSRWMDELHVDRSALAQAEAAAWQGGHTVSWLAMEQGESVHALGMITFADQPKPDAAQSIARLKARGVRTVMISGDNAEAAAHMARQLGIDDVRAPVLPADKARIVRELREALHAPGAPQNQRIAMVGDGINDAPALAAADVGLAMGGGTDIAMETAGLTLMHGTVASVADAMDLSRAVSTKIKQNLFWAFAYNVVSIPLAASGLLSPMVAGAAMALSSVSVVANALLLKRWRPPAR